MRSIIIGLSALTIAALPTLAFADGNGALTGAAGGAVAGAVVGGPVGAAVGGVAGAADRRRRVRTRDGRRRPWACSVQFANHDHSE